MYPTKTYLDIADDTYTRNMGLSLEERRSWSRLEVRDSNTAGRDFLLLKVSFNPIEHPEWGVGSASIRMHVEQVKMLVKALQRFVKLAEGGGE